MVLQTFIRRMGLVPSFCKFCKDATLIGEQAKVHKDAINFCQNILRQKPVEWKPIVRNNLSEPIRDVDLVATVEGDGTLLQGSHFIDDSVPVLGVNSDPTQPEEVGKLRNEFDANRSTGYLCGVTVNNFEQADCGKLGEYDSPVLRSSEEELEDYECIGEVPEASWMVTQVPSPPTASGLYRPKSFQNPSDSSTMFVPDICHSQMESPLRSQHNVSYTTGMLSWWYHDTLEILSPCVSWFLGGATAKALDPFHHRPELQQWRKQTAEFQGLQQQN